MLLIAFPPLPSGRGDGGEGVKRQGRRVKQGSPTTEVAGEPLLNEPVPNLAVGLERVVELRADRQLIGGHRV